MEEKRSMLGCEGRLKMGESGRGSQFVWREWSGGKKLRSAAGRRGYMGNAKTLMSQTHVFMSPDHTGPCLDDDPRRWPMRSRRGGEWERDMKAAAGGESVRDVTGTRASGVSAKERARWDEVGDGMKLSGRFRGIWRLTAGL